MVLENGELRDGLIDVVKEIRRYKGAHSAESLKRILGIKPSILNQVFHLFSLTESINNPDRVQCAQYGSKTIKPKPSYICFGCPLLDVTKCLAGQIVYLEKHEDSREEGRHLRSGHNTVPRRPPAR
jgi:hypothetical protein